MSYWNYQPGEEAWRFSDSEGAFVEFVKGDLLIVDDDGGGSCLSPNEADELLWFLIRDLQAQRSGIVSKHYPVKKSGPEKIREAIAKARGADEPPMQPQGFA